MFICKLEKIVISLHDHWIHTPWIMTNHTLRSSCPCHMLNQYRGHLLPYYKNIKN